MVAADTMSGREVLEVVLLLAVLTVAGYAIDYLRRKVR